MVIWPIFVDAAQLNFHLPVEPVAVFGQKLPAKYQEHLREIVECATNTRIGYPVSSFLAWRLLIENRCDKSFVENELNFAKMALMALERGEKAEWQRNYGQNFPHWSVLSYVLSFLHPESFHELKALFFDQIPAAQFEQLMKSTNFMAYLINRLPDDRISSISTDNRNDPFLKCFPWIDEGDREISFLGEVRSKKSALVALLRYLADRVGESINLNVELVQGIDLYEQVLANIEVMDSSLHSLLLKATKGLDPGPRATRLAVKVLTAYNLSEDIKLILLKIFFEEKAVDINTRIHSLWIPVDRVPLDLATIQGYPKIVKYLLKKGSDMNRVPIALFPTNPVMKKTPLLSPPQLALEEFDWDTFQVFENWSQKKDIPISYELSEQEIRRRNVFETAGIGGVRTLVGMQREMSKYTQVRKAGHDENLYALSGLKVHFERANQSQKELISRTFDHIFADAELKKIPTLNALFSSIREKGAKLNFIVIKEDQSSFELDFAMDHAEGIFVPAYQGILLKTRCFEHLDSVIIHELGHWHGSLSSPQYPAWFDELVTKEPRIDWSDPIQYLAFNPDVLGKPLDDRNRSRKLAEYYTRIYFEYPYRLYRAGLSAQDIADKIEGILPGAMKAFLAQ